MRDHRSKSFPECVTCETEHRGAAGKPLALFTIFRVQVDHVAAGDSIGLGCDFHHFELVSILVREHTISTSQELMQSSGLRIKLR